MFLFVFLFKKEKVLEDVNEVKKEGNKLFGDGFYEDVLLKYEFVLYFV